MNPASLCCVAVGLMTVSGSKVSVVDGGGRILRDKIPFSFDMMKRGLLIMMRGVVMMASRRMFASHLCPLI